MLCLGRIICDYIKTIIRRHVVVCWVEFVIRNCFYYQKNDFNIVLMTGNHFKYIAKFCVNTGIYRVYFSYLIMEVWCTSVETVYMFTCFLSFLELINYADIQAIIGFLQSLCCIQSSSFLSFFVFFFFYLSKSHNVIRCHTLDSIFLFNYFLTR